MAAPRRGTPSLLWRVFFTNAVVIVFAWAVLAFSPAQVESPIDALELGIAGIAGLALMLVLNLVLLRRAMAPLNRLTAAMGRVDPLRPGSRVRAESGVAEVNELARAFNEMAERLERERRQSAGRALAAQESERLRVAQELHDEIGQSLTGLLLQLEHAVRNAPPELRDDLLNARESARASLEEVRNVAHGLRPEALDDLGLRSALSHLTDRIGSQASLSVQREIDPDLPPLSPDAELVVYRVAQEALTNAIRHGAPEHVRLRLGRSGARVRLVVRDDGRGLNGAGEGAGITGMRERALLVGADFAIANAPGGGVEVRLDVEADA